MLTQGLAKRCFSSVQVLLYAHSIDLIVACDNLFGLDDKLNG